MKAGSKILLAVAAVGAYLVAKKKSVAGVGATKRRIFKELSLAQKAGVDFTKKYDELTVDEIEALQKVSNDTGYTETYYKSLKKAYDAISGIGAVYDVTDADGNTVLTWIEDPTSPQNRMAYSADDEAERERALLEAREIEADRDWYEQEQARKREEMEKELAETRKRLKKAGRSSQMALFGVGILTYNKQQIDTYLNTHHDISELTVEPDGERYLIGIGDETGGRNFYVGKNNYLYIRSWFLQRGLPVYIWTGDYWITRNVKNEGTGYASDVEQELYEIWREQIEYGETEWDYETWRDLVGDEYAESMVLPYMR